MTDRINSLEHARRQLGLGQADLAKILGMTQGHYSKVVRRKVPLSSKLEDSMRVWLDANGVANNVEGGSELRMRELAASIRTQCIELMQLADRALFERGSAGR
jgi:transcriptional regulator with XRE-family HTH domain